TTFHFSSSFFCFSLILHLHFFPTRRSSDLDAGGVMSLATTPGHAPVATDTTPRDAVRPPRGYVTVGRLAVPMRRAAVATAAALEIGRASCRERGQIPVAGETDDQKTKACRN